MGWRNREQERQEWLDREKNGYPASGKADPLVVWAKDIAVYIEDYARQHAARHPTKQLIGGVDWAGDEPQVQGYNALDYIADQAGCTSRNLRRILKGEQKYVSLSLADRIMSAINRPDLRTELRVVPNPGWSNETWQDWKQTVGGCDLD